MNLRYDLEEKPPPAEFLAISIQWLALTASLLIIGGRVVAEIQYESGFEKTIYLQKVFFIAGMSLLAQLFFGHRLPLVFGPSAVLIVAIYANLESGLLAIYTAIAICGAILFIFAMTGKMSLLRSLFTERVVAVVLLLVAISLIPAIMDLILNDSPPYSFLFSMILLLSLIILSITLKGFWNSSIIIFALLFGSAIYLIIFPQQLAISEFEFTNFFYDLIPNFSFRVELIFAFLICYLALAINDLSSIYSLGRLLKANEMEKRIKKGVSLTGISNIFSGFFGVVGMVNYTLSPGMISTTKCASRFPLVPVGVILIIFAFIPSVISIFGAIPRTVIGTIFLYLMCSQVALAFTMIKVEDVDSGLVIGFPVLLAVLITFIPESAMSFFPEILKPILGNSFVVGVLSAMLMEAIAKRYESS
ncbi:MAG: purine/pyrimidine permease [Archaeoglobaceae archaeon]|nr:purine/pyrimidine permease [Archaeoglobaceae archaeon]MDW8127686.1 solute carrier family 23 protein [Archaeoglobaceae archaeon]